MPTLSTLARRRKLEYFLHHLPKHARILEVGCADGWVGAYAVAHGWTDYLGIDVVPPPRPLAHPFLRLDINDWAAAGLRRGSFDAIIAFEVIEHGDFFGALADLLRPGGLLLVTTPLPHLDWACRLLEEVGLNQKRTSPHSHLLYLRDVPPPFEPAALSIHGGLSQWGIFRRAPLTRDG